LGHPKELNRTSIELVFVDEKREGGTVQGRIAFGVLS
jgi:hypothetical protein